MSEPVMKDEKPILEKDRNEVFVIYPYPAAACRTLNSFVAPRTDLTPTPSLRAVFDGNRIGRLPPLCSGHASGSHRP